MWHDAEEGSTSLEGGGLKSPPVPQEVAASHGGKKEGGAQRDGNIMPTAAVSEPKQEVEEPDEEAEEKDEKEVDDQVATVTTGAGAIGGSKSKKSKKKKKKATTGAVSYTHL